MRSIVGSLCILLMLAVATPAGGWSPNMVVDIHAANRTDFYMAVHVAPLSGGADVRVPPSQTRSHTASWWTSNQPSQQWVYLELHSQNRPGCLGRCAAQYPVQCRFSMALEWDGMRLAGARLGTNMCPGSIGIDSVGYRADDPRIDLAVTAN